MATGLAVKIGEAWVGDDQAHYVIAEIGSNHNGDLDLAKRHIDLAAQSGASAAKFQSWTPSTLVGEREYERNTSYADTHRHFGSLKSMVTEYALSADDHYVLSGHCADAGIDFMSSAFSNDEVDLLVDAGAVAIKIASMDIDNPMLMEHAASAGLPVILSTGMATFDEIAAAVTIFDDAGAELVLLHCVSIYPAEPRKLNLRNIPTFLRSFGRPVGFSDHSRGTAAAVAATALGSCMTEKHFTLDRTLPGWDHHMSADPVELAELVVGCEAARTALGHPQRRLDPEELNKRRSFRRSLVLRRSVPAGDVLTEDHLVALRPGTGISPRHLRAVTGRAVICDLPAHHELSWEDIGLEQ